MITPTNGNLFISMKKDKGEKTTKSGIVLLKIEESYGEEATILEVSKDEEQFKKGDAIFVKDYQVIWMTDMKENEKDFGFINSKEVLGKR